MTTSINFILFSEQTKEYVCSKEPYYLANFKNSNDLINTFVSCFKKKVLVANFNKIELYFVTIEEPVLITTLEGLITLMTTYKHQETVIIQGNLISKEKKKPLKTGSIDIEKIEQQTTILDRNLFRRRLLNEKSLRKIQQNFSDFSCKICEEIIFDPVSCSQCKEAFCRECLQNLINSFRKCPLDECYPIRINNSLPEWKKAKLEKIKVKCFNNCQLFNHEDEIGSKSSRSSKDTELLNQSNYAQSSRSSKEGLISPSNFLKSSRSFREESINLSNYANHLRMCNRQTEEEIIYSCKHCNSSSAFSIKIDELAKDKSNLKEERIHLKNQIEELTLELNMKDKTLLELEKNAIALQQVNGNLQDQIQIFEEKEKFHLEENKDLAKYLDEMQHVLDDKDKTLTEVRIIEEEDHKHLENLRLELEEKEKSLREMKRNEKALQEDSTSLNSHLKVELEEKENSMREMERNEKALQEDKTSLQSQVQAFEEEIEKLKKEKLRKVPEEFKGIVHEYEIHHNPIKEDAKAMKLLADISEENNYKLLQCHSSELTEHKMFSELQEEINEWKNIVYELSGKVNLKGCSSYRDLTKKIKPLDEEVYKIVTCLENKTGLSPEEKNKLQFYRDWVPWESCNVMSKIFDPQICYLANALYANLELPKSNKNKIKMNKDYKRLNTALGLLEMQFKESRPMKHASDVFSIISLNATTIASCSKDMSIKIWDLVTDECVMTLLDHTDTITGIAKISGSIIASASKDKTIKIWNTNTGKCLRSIEAHAFSINCLSELNENKLASGGSDNLIKIWDINLGKCLKQLTGHKSNVWCLIQLDENRIVSGSGDHSIKIWDCDTGKNLNDLTGHKNAVFRLTKLSDSLIVSGSWDKTIKLWEFSTGKCLKTLTGHLHFIYCLVKINDSLIASGSGDKTIKVWDYQQGECLNTLTGHTDTVRCLLKLNGSQIASGSVDASIKIWNISR